MQDFVREFLQVPDGRGNIRFVSAYEGFTLRDLVSYNEKHNDANGEGGMDGESDNLSWNCGQEGHTARLEVRQLRKQQIKNFLCLLFLSQGTPWMAEGDERFNTRDGNNNPWCQDNPMGWVTWNTDEDAQAILAFARAISRFRREHPVFRMRRPFRFQDYKGLGFPDISFHGTEAWKPDLGGYSHSLGIMFCENYARPSDRLELLYLAVNTYWEKVSLGLPRLPAGYQWGRVTDTSLASAFPDFRQLLGDQRSVAVRPRSIQILQAVWVGIPGQVPERVPLRGLKLPWGGKQLYTKTSADAGTRKRYLSPSNRDRIFRYAARR
jgi:glycogen operon protein